MSAAGSSRPVLLTDPVPPPGSWTCPRCDEAFATEPDAAGMVACPQGHRAYTGYLAEAAQLRPRLQWLDDRITAGDPAPDEETARRGRVWPATSGQPTPTGTAAVPPGVVPSTGDWRDEPREGPGVQVLLLGLGAALLIVAAIVFTAVVWDRLGALGQVGIMSLATLGFGAAAVRLRERLPGTAEALAAVAFGFAAVDAVAAPALGLVPDAWLDVETAYGALVACVGAALFVLLGRRIGLRAWVWLGWGTAAIGAALVTWYLALGPADSTNPWAAASVTVVALAAVALQAGPYASAHLARDLHPMTVAGVVAMVLAGPAWIRWVVDLDRPAIVGTLVTTALTGGALVVVWQRTSLRRAGLAAAVLTGVVGGLALLFPSVEQGAWLAVLPAAGGVLLLGVLARNGYLGAGLLASISLWVPWILGRLTLADPMSAEDPVYLQLAVLLAAIAGTWFVVAWRGHQAWIAWAAAGAGWLAWVCARPSLPDLPSWPETWTLPLAVLLLVAGAVWQRSAAAGSLEWVGPGTTVALIPSALACWGAPWVAESTDQTTQEAVVRLVLVLLASVVVVVLGARRRLSGLLLPGAAALALAGGAQVWTGLTALPRWLAIALAGATLFVLGARIEWLRRGSRRARTFVEQLH